MITARVLGAFAILHLLPRASHAQASFPHPARLVPTLAVGRGSLSYSRGGDAYYDGIAVRAGAHAFGYFAFTLLGERWPNLSRSGTMQGGWSLLVEGSFHPLGVRRVAPYVLFGVGHFSEVVDGSTSSPAHGRSAEVGLGLQANLWRGFGLRTEYVVRLDATMGNEEGRVFVNYAPVAGAPRGARVAGVLYGMMPLGGVWHFAEPGYGIRTLSRVSQRDHIALDVAVFHWRTLDPQRPYGYGWDTRAVLIMPGWTRLQSIGAITGHAHVGFAGSVMIEGPDRGFVPGTYAEGGIHLEVGPLRIETGIGWLWLSRKTSGSTPGTDQHALLFHAALGS